MSIDKQWLQEIEARLQAATPGPWFWNLNRSGKQLSLACRQGFGDTVLDFVRWGMGGAAGRFNTKGLMHRADELATPHKGREHHADWCADIDHPDAQFIAHARQDVPDLISALRESQAREQELQSQLTAILATVPPTDSDDPLHDNEARERYIARIRGMAEGQIVPATWTTERPGVDGWYWYCYWTPGGYWDVSIFEIFDGTPFTGRIQMRDLCELDGEWAGPLHPPTTVAPQIVPATERPDAAPTLPPRPTGRASKEKGATMKYRVTGTIELNWENIVDADSEEEAEKIGIGFAMDGQGLGIPVGYPDDADIELVDEAQPIAD